jgi:hypothetical protein
VSQPPVPSRPKPVRRRAIRHHTLDRGAADHAAQSVERRDRRSFAASPTARPFVRKCPEFGPRSRRKGTAFFFAAKARFMCAAIDFDDADYWSSPPAPIRRICLRWSDRI